MYKVVEVISKEGKAEWYWGVRGTTLVALADEYGGRARIVRDDRCLVLLLDVGNGFKPTVYWFKEAVEAIPKKW